MKDRGYLFDQFRNCVVDRDNPKDPVVEQMTEIANKHNLVLDFFKINEDGGAAVMPPDNQVTVSLLQGDDNLWRVRRAR